MPYDNRGQCPRDNFFSFLRLHKREHKNKLVRKAALTLMMQKERRGKKEIRSGHLLGCTSDETSFSATPMMHKKPAVEPVSHSLVDLPGSRGDR